LSPARKTITRLLLASAVTAAVRQVILIIDAYNAQKRATGDDQGKSNVYVLPSRDR
jgi:hypothetical protein